MYKRQALPKQVILIPLMKEMSDLGLIHSVWGSMFAVICPVDVYKRQTQYNDAGADVIFACAGGSGNGVHNAAEEAQKFVIGVDSDQSLQLSLIHILSLWSWEVRRP